MFLKGLAIFVLIIDVILLWIQYKVFRKKWDEKKSPSFVPSKYLIIAEYLLIFLFCMLIVLFFGKNPNDVVSIVISSFSLFGIYTFILNYCFNLRDKEHIRDCKNALTAINFLESECKDLNEKEFKNTYKELMEFLKIEFAIYSGKELNGVYNSLKQISSNESLKSFIKKIQKDANLLEFKIILLENRKGINSILYRRKANRKLMTEDVANKEEIIKYMLLYKKYTKK